MPPPTRTARTASRLDEISSHVALLTGTPSQGELLELRFRRAREGMARRFYPASRPAGLIEAVERLGRRTDVFVGCALRGRRAGSRDAVAHSWVLWAECDTPTARETLEAFTPPPTLVIASGSPHGRHAYWALTAPVTAQTLENANLRVAHALGADLACVDAARILRPPNTLNFKRDRPTAVTMLTHRSDDITGSTSCSPTCQTSRLAQPKLVVRLTAHEPTIRCFQSRRMNTCQRCSGRRSAATERCHARFTQTRRQAFTPTPITGSALAAGPAERSTTSPAGYGSSTPAASAFSNSAAGCRPRSPPGTREGDPPPRAASRSGSGTGCRYRTGSA
jgi:hypothetical protein